MIVEGSYWLAGWRELGRDEGSESPSEKEGLAHEESDARKILFAVQDLSLIHIYSVSATASEATRANRGLNVRQRFAAGERRTTGLRCV